MHTSPRTGLPPANRASADITSSVTAIAAGITGSIFTSTVPAWWDVTRGHQIASDIENEIQNALSEGNATAHIEPCRDATCIACSANTATPSTAATTPGAVP